MRPNLIQSYMNNMPALPPDKKDRKLDINYVLSNRTFIKPLPARGHIVNNTIFDAPAVAVKDTLYDFKSLKKAGNGNANDHELGKINDFAMKVGGLAIAGYLMTRKQTPLTKAMELVGLGAFFGSMALWPKIALQLPAKLIHGVNIRKEYEDSFGRKKMFFQDPQYIPWDLVSDERINKIGDRMNVPNNMPNRRDFIQEKMKKVAVQNNTLWMLTAGFATPVMSALICNQLENPLNKMLDNYNSKYADKLLDNIGTNYKKHIDKDSVKAFEDLITGNQGKVITPELAEEIKNTVSKGIDRVTAQSLASDIDKILGIKEQKSLINEDVIKNTVASVKQVIDTIIPNAQYSLPETEDIIAALKSKKFFNKTLNEIDMKKATYVVAGEIKKSLQNSNVENQTITRIFNVIVNKDKTISKGLRGNSQNILDENTVSTLKNISKVLVDFKAKNAVLDEYAYLKAAHAPETVLANAWNEVTGSLPKLFKISDEEMSTIKYDRTLAGKLLREKMELITSQNSTEYENVFQALVEKISQLDAKIKILDQSKDAKGSYESAVDSLFEETAKELRKYSMHATPDNLVGKNGSDAGSLKNIQISYMKNRLMGVRSSLYRMLNTMDFYRRISTLTNIPALHSQMPKELKEEIIEFAKTISIEGSTADFMTKFYMRRNPKPNHKLDNVEVDKQTGKIINKYYQKRPNMVDLPNDKNFFKEVMKLLFENEMHPDSDKILANSLIKDKVKDYREAFLRELGDSDYFAKPHHLLGNHPNKVSSYTKFLRVGMPPDQMLHNTSSQIYNTRKWLKMFGGIGAGLLTSTILAQFFFGKIKTEENV